MREFYDMKAADAALRVEVRNVVSKLYSAALRDAGHYAERSALWNEACEDAAAVFYRKYHDDKAVNMSYALMM